MADPFFFLTPFPAYLKWSYIYNYQTMRRLLYALLLLNVFIVRTQEPITGEPHPRENTASRKTVEELERLALQHGIKKVLGVQKEGNGYLIIETPTVSPTNVVYKSIRVRRSMPEDQPSPGQDLTAFIVEAVICNTNAYFVIDGKELQIKLDASIPFFEAKVLIEKLFRGEVESQASLKPIAMEAGALRSIRRSRNGERIIARFENASVSGRGAFEYHYEYKDGRLRLIRCELIAF